MRSQTMRRQTMRRQTMRRQTMRRQTLRCLCLNKFNRFLARSANRATNGVNQTRCWPTATVLDAALNSMKTPKLLPLPQKRRTLPRFRGTSGSWSLRPPSTWDGVSSKACNPSSETGFLTARYGCTAAINHPKILEIRGVRLGQSGSLEAVTRAVAQFGSASGWGSEGRRFKSFQPDYRSAPNGASEQSDVTGSNTLFGPLHSNLFAV